MYIVHFNYLHCTLHFDLWPSFIKSRNMLENEIAQSYNNVLLAGIFRPYLMPELVEL